MKTEQEKKCENCPYAKGGPCVTASCYKDLEKWLRDRRAKTVQKIMQEERNVVRRQRNGGTVYVG